MIECREVSLSFGEKKILDGCSLRLGPGERAALMSPSGCGKTTLLRVLLSLLKPDSGSVTTDARRIGAVFQEVRLLPWRTVAQNVNLVLSDRAESMPQALAWLKKVELAGEAEKYPTELSGGMRQRVALARALAVAPEVLILDEPFRGMDGPLRTRMAELIVSSAPDASILMATHSEEEAEALGCTIFRYRDGCFSR